MPGDSVVRTITFTVADDAQSTLLNAGEISMASGGVDINSVPDDDPDNDDIAFAPGNGGNVNGTKENDFDLRSLTVCQTGTCVTAKYKRVR